MLRPMAPFDNSREFVLLSGSVSGCFQENEMVSRGTASPKNTACSIMKVSSPYPNLFPSGVVLALPRTIQATTNSPNVFPSGLMPALPRTIQLRSNFIMVQYVFVAHCIVFHNEHDCVRPIPRCVSIMSPGSLA